MRRFFQITGVLIILFAAGLVARAVQFFQAAGDIGSYDLNGVYDLTRYRWLTQDSQVGRFLAGIFGWDPRPSIEQVVAYLGLPDPGAGAVLPPARRSGPRPSEQAVGDGQRVTPVRGRDRPPERAWWWRCR